MSKITTREELLSSFEVFRSELDDYNDRRERLIKASRDITNLSKKVIFLLHRLIINRLTDEREHDRDDGNSNSNTNVANTNTKQNKQNAFADAAAQAKKKLLEIQALFRQMGPELAGDNFWRHQRSVSPGLQEYIEALSFTHYLETSQLISYAQVQNSLCDERGVPIFLLPLDDYLLGVSDLTGELMRFAINAISHRGGRAKAREISDFVRNCKADFEGFVPYIRHLGKKQHVTGQSLLKIEEAAYAIAVRSSEYPVPEELLEDIVRRCMSEVQSHDNGQRGRWKGQGAEDISEMDLDEE